MLKARIDESDSSSDVRSSSDVSSSTPVVSSSDVECISNSVLESEVESDTSHATSDIEILPGVNLDDSNGDVCGSSDPSVTLKELHRNIKLPDFSWSDQSTDSLIRVCKLSTSSAAPIVVTHCLQVDMSLSWSLYVYNRDAKHSSSLNQFAERLQSADSLNNLIRYIGSLRVCIGQPDHHFVDMATAKKGVFKGKDGSISAFLDTYALVVTTKNEVYNSTIRSVKCELLATSERCHSCSTYRATIRKLCNRWCDRSTDSNSDVSGHTNFRYLNTPEKKAKVVGLKRRVNVAENEVKKLQRKIEAMTEQQGERVDTGLHNDLLKIMEEKSPEIASTYPEGTYFGKNNFELLAKRIPVKFVGIHSS